MNSPSLTITVQNATGSADGYWLRLEQEGLPDDAATVSDAAALLNALYNIDPCTQDTTTAPAPVSTTGEPAVPVDEFAALVASTLDFVDCSINPDGDIDVTLRVIRSHQGEPYRLNLHGGSIKETVTFSTEITRSLEIAPTTVLDYPLLGALTTNIRPESVNGNTLTFGEYHTGRTLIATYPTRYDQVTVTINGIDGDPGECTALGFYHGLVEELDLQTPEPVEIDPNWCQERNIRTRVDQVEHSVTCYETVVSSTRCSCDREETSWDIYDRVVDCPEWITRCPDPYTVCESYVRTVQETEYVACADDTTRAHDPDFYEEVCCKRPSVSLPNCLHQRLTYKGGQPIQNGEQFYRDLYGPETRVHPVPPEDGNCGDWYIDQEYTACIPCDGVAAIVWDTATSPTTVAPNSSNLLAVTGGRAPYTWTVSGYRFQFTANQATTIVTAQPWVYLSALTLSCGTATITVDDGCSTVTAGIRSTAGKWLQINQFNPVAEAMKEWGSYFPAGQPGVCNYLPACSANLTVAAHLWAGAYWLNPGVGNFPIPPNRLSTYSHLVPLTSAPSGLIGWTFKDPIVGVFDVPWCFDIKPGYGFSTYGLYCACVTTISTNPGYAVHEWVCQ
jgi:hypothetical protein